MTDSPSEAPEAPEAAAADTAAADYAAEIASLLGAGSSSGDFDTAKVFLEPEQWVDAHRTLAETLPFFSWLSAIDWSNEVAVGDAPDEPVEEGFEVISRLADVTEGKGVILSTRIDKESPSLPTLTGVFGGAEWHEREAHEMFGIDFAGHPKLTKLYLPDAFEGHPLRKDYPLLSREVKPWPGTVDVEDMPSTENPEATDEAPAETEGGEQE